MSQVVPSDRLIRHPVSVPDTELTIIGKPPAVPIKESAAMLEYLHLSDIEWNGWARPRVFQSVNVKYALVSHPFHSSIILVNSLNK